MKKIAVIGAGTMGCGIAQILAQYQYDVHLVDNQPTALKKAQQMIKTQLQLFIQQKLLPETSYQTTWNHLHFSDSLQSAKDCDLIFEAIPENLSLKQNLYQQLEEIISPKAILATNTSSLSINQLSAKLNRPERFIGTHFFMPASLIPLVEVIPTEKTETSTTEAIQYILTQIGKKPVILQKDIPGFIANRIQHAIAREAISLVEQNVATAEEIDLVTRYSIGIRLLLTGPLEQRDLNGLDIHHDIAQHLYPKLANQHKPSLLLSEKVQKGDLGVKTGKGFYDWSDHSPHEIISQKNKQLLKLLFWLRENNFESDYDQ